jgi:acetone carboxylase gamma subunit
METLTVKTYDGPGRARKCCPNGHYVHAKVYTCVCGHEFKQKENTQEEVKPAGTTYDTGGKGKRKCPNCPKYVGVRATSCPECGFNFDGYVGTKVVTVDKVAPATYTEGGKGKKQCPSCSVYIGARVLECVCGHNFKQEEKEASELNCAVEELKATESPPVKLSFAMQLGLEGYRTTYTPAGACPYKLASTDKESVVAWIEKIHTHFTMKREVLAPTGYRYYAREFFDVFSDDYSKVKSAVNEYFAQYAE